MRFLVSLFFLVPCVLHAQEKKDKKPGDEMIEKYLAAETDKLSRKFLDGAKTIDEWKQKRPRLYQEYMDMLGLWPMPEKTPLKATKTGEVEAHGVIVEKIHFQSKPGLYVTANVYRAPNFEKRKLPAILYVCGHSWKGRDGNKTAFQDHGFWFANNGYICIILDTLQLGEIAGVHHGTYGTPWRHIKEKNKPENRFWWHAIGYSPAAVECWNGIRAIDYLCTREDVDPERIGVTGISGGGAATFWIAAADDRIKVAVPVSGMSDLEFYIKNKGINSHCDCMFLYNTYQWDWTTIAALVAPRPMLFANSDKDAIFPMDANRRIYKKLQKIYGMYGVERAVREYVSSGGHDYREDLRIAIFHFFNVHLKGTPTMVVEDSAKYKPIEGRKLRVFPEDADIPKDAINGRIDETFIAAAKVKLPEKAKFEDWRATTMKRLKAGVFPYFAKRIPTGNVIEEEFGSGQSLHGVRVTEGPVAVEVSRLTNRKDDKEIGTAFITSQVDQISATPPEVVQKLTGAQRVHVIGVRGYANNSWTEKSPPNYVARSHALLGRTPDEGRVWDTIAVIRRLSEEDPKRKSWRVSS